MSLEERNKTDELRQRAEALLAKSPDSYQPADVKDVNILAQELAVHQAELELQNEALRETQQALQEAKDRFVGLYENAPVGYVVLDASGIVRQTNATWQVMMNHDEDDFRGKPFTDAMVAEDAPLFLARFRAFYRNPKEKQIVVRMKRKGAPPFYASIEARARAYTNETAANGDDAELMVIVSDISDLHEAQQQVERSNHDLKQINKRMTHMNAVLSAIRNVNQLITQEEDPMRLIERACVNLTETMGYHNAWIALLDADGTDVTAMAASGFDGGFKPLHTDILAGRYPACMKNALENNAIVIIENPREQCRDCPVSKEYGGRAGLSRRLRFRDRTYGVIAVSVPANYAQDAEEQTLFDEVANDLAFALYKIDAAAALQESQRRYRQIFEGSRDGFVMVDVFGRILDANQAYCDLLGYSLEELRAMPDFHQITPERWRNWEAREIWENRLLRQGYSGLYEKEYLRKNGTVFPVEMQSYAVGRADGAVEYIWGIAREVTERRRMEEAVANSHDAMLAIFDNIDEPIYVADPTTYELLFSNRALRALLGERRSLKCHQYLQQRETPCPFCTNEKILGDYLGRSWVWEFRNPVTGRWFKCIDKAIPWPDGRLVRYEMAVDITERKQAEIQNKLLLDIIQRSQDFIGVADVNHHAFFVNPAGKTMVGLDGDASVKATSIEDYFFPEDLPFVQGTILPALRTRGRWSGEFRFRHFKTGQPVYVLYELFLSEDPATGQRTNIATISRDITAHKNAERALTEKDMRLREAVRAANVGLWDWDLISNKVHYSAEWKKQLGYEEDEINDEFEEWERRVHPDDLGPALDRVRRAIANAEQGYHMEFRLRHKDGAYRWILAQSSAFCDETGEPVRLLGSHIDITERRLEQDALKIKTQLLQSVTDNMFDLVAVTDLKGNFTFVGASHSILGYEISALIGLNVMDFVHPDDYSSVAAAFEEFLTTREDNRRVEYRYRCASDGYLWLETVGKFIRNDAGEPQQILFSSRDITQRKMNEEALRESEQRFRSFVENANDIIYTLSPEGVFLYISPNCLDFLGKPAEAVIGRSFKPFLHPEDVHRCREFLATVMTTGEKLSSVEYRVKHANGSWRWHVSNGSPVRDSDGRAVYFVGISRDVTERIALESQLNQAQKMESVGRLAGGVAHDFNNMLNVILGHAEMALECLPADSSLRESLEEINNAAERSANLTRQLLAFARKQTVAPKAIDLNAAVEGMLQMLRRLIGEDIKLAWLPDQTIEPIKMDPSQIDHILANLCVNARDAIGHNTGKITIETGNAVFDNAYCAHHPGYVAGKYVLLAVSDTGCGMDRDALEHIFEPFFTTKGVGEGTGLGLATVYGAVRQNQGFINVYSEPGAGTTFRIYLPAYAALEASKASAATAAESIARGGHETILIVEDETAILKMTQTMLQGLGYRVLTASTPSQAIQLAAEHVGEIQLLITDVVMPEMNGRDLAAKLLTLYPGIKRLFMSGYTANVIAHQGVLDEGVHFIQKPFSRQDLSVKVRAALQSP